MKNYIEVGFLVKSFGTQGFLKASFNEFYLNDIEKSNVLFINITGDYIPYFIESNQFDQFFKLKLEGVDSKELASKLSAKKIYLRTRDVLEIEPQLNTDAWIGYSIFNSNTNQRVGEIFEIIELPEQELAKIIVNGAEKLIPLHENIILNIDDNKRLIFMDLPEGILDF